MEEKTNKENDFLFSFSEENSANKEIVSEEYEDDNQEEEDDDVMVGFSSKEEVVLDDEEAEEQFRKEALECSEILEVSEVAEPNIIENIVVPNVNLEKVSYGEYLRNLREINGLTIEDIVKETRISKMHIESLEDEDLDNLPPIAYVLGYIRKICDIYKIPKEEIAILTKELKEQLEDDNKPEDITKSVVAHEISEENERKLKKLLIFGTIIVVVIVGLLIFGVVALWMNFSSKNETKTTLVQKSGNEDIIQIMPKLKVKPLELD